MEANNKMYLQRAISKEIPSERLKNMTIILNPDKQIVEPYKELPSRADKGEKRMKYVNHLPKNYTNYIRRANGGGLSFELTIEEFERIMSMPCVYCGDTNYPTIDRMDSSRGYDVDNVQPMCHACNCFKGVMSVSTIDRQLRKIIKNLIKTGRLDSFLNG
jgi:hypothetical protein